MPLTIFPERRSTNAKTTVHSDLPIARFFINQLSSFFQPSGYRLLCVIEL
jgi:hypothetical protein